ncbi:DUF2851 family protein [Fulvivirgaceae bacterium BMA10]|uniref:DUF2851 family protein n=1 Tax=Splendidivirga corallicola TaxID=3051826 RepID=A0ABT8KIS1_9BACT|nr:DUF2851 family protein [Fulvivirgaceae bacterium BMA10]
MKEDFLHFVWKHQYFDKKNLVSTNKEPINIFHPGFQNFDSGPDFSNTKLRIDNIDWHGHTEIHIKSSHWNAHAHQSNPAYDQVILHVVWEDDRTVHRSDGTKIPTLELKNRIASSQMKRYEGLMHHKGHILCIDQLNSINNITKLSMFDRVLMSRLEYKSTLIQNMVGKHCTWEEVTYQTLAKNFGFKINAYAFLELARALPLKYIHKHSDSLFQIEAMLFGQAGFLEETYEVKYFKHLKQEYNFLSHKYDLKNRQLATHYWKFLRLRPANFPTIRIAQFAILCHIQRNLFSLFKEVNTYEDIAEILSILQSEFWQYHYHFDKRAKKALTGLGKFSINNIIINTIVPLRMAYGRLKDKQDLIENAIALLEKVPAESNNIVTKWRKAGIDVKNAFYSQASLELYNSFCKEKKCLFCNIGISIIRSS